MAEDIRITEVKDFDLQDGHIIDGFPYDGHAGSIAAEAMVRTIGFEFAGFMDSKSFPPVSIVRDGIPNFPVSIFVNEKLKVAVFLSHLRLPESFSKGIATAILQYAKKHKCKQIISSMKVNEVKTSKEINAIGSTDNARNIIKKLGMDTRLNAMITGIPGILLAQGRFSNQNVIVLLFSEKDNKNSDLEYGAKLCLTIGMLIPNLPCNIKLIEGETVKIEKMIIQTEKESKAIKDSMYG